MKFKHTKTGVIVEAKNMFEQNILLSNPSYTVLNDVEEKAGNIEVKPHKPAKKGGK